MKNQEEASRNSKPWYLPVQKCNLNITWFPAYSVLSLNILLYHGPQPGFKPNSPCNLVKSGQV